MTSANDKRLKQLTAPESISERNKYVSCAKRFILKGLVFLGIFYLGYNGFSIAWLLGPFFLTIIREREKSEREFSLLKASQNAFESEKEMIESRTKENDSPSWVYFPEKV